MAPQRIVPVTRSHGLVSMNLPTSSTPSIKIFDSDYLAHLSALAKDSPRQRQHLNIHESFDDPCQRIINAIEPNSYIRPHRHLSDPKHELLIAIRGGMALVIFDHMGRLARVIPFGVFKSDVDSAVAIEVPPSAWHTVIAFTPGCVLLETKAGPFNPFMPKDLAPWAPKEGSEDANTYFSHITAQILEYVPF